MHIILGESLLESEYMKCSNNNVNCGFNIFKVEVPCSEYILLTGVRLLSLWRKS